jgi:CheY-like chemotaxis protein
VGYPVSNETAGGVTSGYAEGSVRTEEFSVPSKGCIVIVEPDELIRELLERWLVEAGYQVVLVDQDHAPAMVTPRLVITDVSDPACAGNTIEALQAAYAAPILASSARFRRGLAGSSEPARRLHVEKVLPKPFTRQQLLRAVREILKRD